VLCFPLAVIESQNGTSVPIQLWQMTVVYAGLTVRSIGRMGMERVQLAFEHPIIGDCLCTNCHVAYILSRSCAAAQFWVAGDDTGSDLRQLLSVSSSGALLGALVQIRSDIMRASLWSKDSAQKVACANRSVCGGLYILVDLLSNAPDSIS